MERLQVRQRSMAGRQGQRKSPIRFDPLDPQAKVLDGSPTQLEQLMNYLVVDMGRILDESVAGRSASEDLSKRWEMAQREFQQLIERAQAGDEEAANRAAELEASVPAELEKRREDHQRQLIERLKPIIATVASETGTALVLRADQTLAFDPQNEITDRVMEILDRD